MSRQDANAKKRPLYGFGSTPEPGRRVGDHHCEACGRWGGFGVHPDGRNGRAYWYCRDHVPTERFTTLEKTFLKQFEEVFLGLNADGGSRPNEAESPREG